MSDYPSKFGLEYDPFIKNQRKEYLLMTSEFSEVQTRLDYLKDIHGFGLLTGQPGMGKTTAVRKWVKGLNENLYMPVYISLSTVTVLEFYKELAFQLKCEVHYRKVDNFHSIQNEITRLSVEKGITPVIIIDEAQYIQTSILNDLKMMFNFEMDSKERAIVLLVGLSTLNVVLQRSSNEPLRQRIVMNYNMESLSQKETHEYILSKIKNAGGTDNIFDEQALNAISSASQGIPRIIDRLCSRSLIAGNTLNQRQITSDIVMSARNDMRL